MTWLEVLAVVAVGYLIFRFVLKPLIKFFAFIALAIAVWLLLMN